MKYKDYDDKNYRVGLVSYTKFNHNKPPKYLTEFIKGLGILVNDYQNQNLVCCIGGNKRGFEYWLGLFYPRMNIPTPIVFDYNTDEEMTSTIIKLEMYMNLVENVDSVIYLTHPQKSKNDFGYYIQEKCNELNKPYNEMKIGLLNKDYDTCMDELVKIHKKMTS